MLHNENDCVANFEKSEYSLKGEHTSCSVTVKLCEVGKKHSCPITTMCLVSASMGVKVTKS